MRRRTPFCRTVGQDRRRIGRTQPADEVEVGYDAPRRAVGPARAAPYAADHDPVHMVLGHGPRDVGQRGIRTAPQHAAVHDVGDRHGLPAAGRGARLRDCGADAHVRLLIGHRRYALGGGATSARRRRQTAGFPRRAPVAARATLRAEQPR